MEQKPAPPPDHRSSLDRATGDGTWWIRVIFYVPPGLVMVATALLSVEKGAPFPNFWPALGLSALCVAALEWLLARLWTK